MTRILDAVDHIDQGITLLDSHLRLVVCNRRFAQLVGIPQAAIRLGQPLEKLLTHYAASTGAALEELQPRMAARLARARRPNLCFRACQPPRHGVGHRGQHRAQRKPGLHLYRRHREARANAALRAAYENAERQVERRTRALTDFSHLSSDWSWEQDTEFRFTHLYGNSVEKLRREPGYFMGKRRWDVPNRHPMATETLPNAPR